MKRIFSGLLDKVTTYPTSDAVIAVIEEKMRFGENVNIAFVNAHAFNLACRDANFYSAIRQSDLLLRDGIGVEILFRMLGSDPGENLNGTDLIPQLLERSFKNKRVAIFGSAQEELDKAEVLLRNSGLNVVATVDGFQSEDTYLESLRENVPDVVILAMGMPKQEILSITLQAEMTSLVTVNGGAIIDFLAGKVERAPRWVRACHMEWCFRLFMEPKRLFRRYVVGNVVFLSRAVWIKLITGKRYAN